MRHEREVITRQTTSWGWIVILVIAASAFGGYIVYLGRGLALDDAANETLIAKTESAATTKVELPDTEKPIYVPTFAMLRQGAAWSYVSKSAPLPHNFTPTNLVTVTLPHAPADNAGTVQLERRTNERLTALFQAADRDGYSLMISSAYRSVADQQKLYDDFVTAKGAALAKQYVADPGSSEHHLGLAADVDDNSAACQKAADSCNLSPASAAWLAEHAPEYGFIIRYPSGKQPITGIAAEPWHLRYVGVVLATQLTASGLTFDEFIEQIAPGLATR